MSEPITIGTEIELPGRTVDDPDDERTGVALNAYLHAQHMNAFCRLLWRRLAVFAAVWGLLGWLKIVPVVGVIVGFGLFVALAIGAGVLAWRARTAFQTTSRLADFRGSAAGTGTS